MSSVTQESGGGKPFTAGPWRVSPELPDVNGPASYGIPRTVYSFADENCPVSIASMSGMDGRGPRAWNANARLIAAAPDMYAALEAAYELATSERHDGDDVAAMIRQALSKAKGGAA